MAMVKRKGLKRRKLNLWLISILVLYPLLWYGNAFGNSLSREQAIGLLNDSKNNELIEKLVGKSSTLGSNEKYYILAKAFKAQGHYSSAIEFLDKLDGVVSKDLQDLVIAERLDIYITTRQTDEFLKLTINSAVKTKNPYLVDIIADELIKNHDQYSNLPLLRLAVEEVSAKVKSKDKKPDLVRILVKSYPENHPKRKELLVRLWAVGDVEKLTTVELQINKWIKERHITFTPQIVEHFKSQKRFKNYSYSVQTIPDYLPLLKGKNDRSLDQLRDLYFYSLQKKRQYSYLIDLLKSPQKREDLEVEKIEALDLKLKLQLRKGNPENAKELLNRITKADPQYDPNNAYLAIADFYYQRGDFDKSLMFYQKVNPYKPEGYSVSRIKWQLWRIHYANRNYSELAKISEWSKSHKFENSEIAARFCYWSYKTNTINDGPISQCYEKYPLTYYGLRAREVAKTRLEYSHSIQPLQLYSINKEKLSLENTRKIDVLRMLYQIGEDDLADSIVRKILPPLNRTAQLAIADLLLEAERYYLVQYIVESGFRETMERSISGRNLLLPYFYPKAYQDSIKTHATRFSIPETLILSVMREESHFNPEVESFAGAIGLMQLMPKTASYIGKKIGLSIKTEELIEPDLNITLGSAYLRRLLKRYDGNVIYTLAAYNGGPTNVRRWKKKVGTSDVDEFVESITFNETKNYVRRVMRSYYLYQLLYDQES